MILNNEILTYFCWLLKIFFVPVRTFISLQRWLDKKHIKNKKRVLYICMLIILYIFEV